ncbi:MAG: flagellar basal body rod protein FlgB [Hyphomicrobiaceae bacterium]
MEPVTLFKLAANHNGWLSERQLTIAANIANADTPNFRAQDVAPFSASADSARMTMALSDPKHMPPPASATGAVIEREPDNDPLTKHGGNTVSIDRELLKSQSVRKSFAMNAAIIKAFHGMVLASTKG